MEMIRPASPTGIARRRLLVAGAALATLPAPFVRSQPAAPIRVGFPVPLTGAYREEALDQVRAAKVAIAMFNEQGGINGRKAELLVRDDKLEPAVAIARTRELIEQDGADFIVGGLSASVQLAINNVAKQKKVLFNSISQSDAIVALPDWAPTTFHQALTPHVTAGAVGTSYYWRLEDTIASANTFNRRFRAMNEGRVPTSYGTLGFAGVMTVLTAARTAGSVETMKVVDAMAGMKYDLYKGPEYFRVCDHQAVQSVLIVESRATVNPNDMVVFTIRHIDPPDEAQLMACSELGHV